MEQGHRPTDKGVAHIARQSHQVQKYQHRQRAAKNLVKFAFALVDEFIDQFIGQCADAGFKFQHALRTDDGVYNVAIFAVFWRVDFDRDEVEVILWITRERRCVLVGKIFCMAQREQRILVFG